ncbi:hypothetical protein NHX12_006338 [Muraenolepis orangiensis]|uniref:Ig-like domain-containing protein n=1 Tax=Muraenolepis orangiensis TaxID=630683 RepID=A0A9Q0DT52_9TELE|nr:hypothetical protein NHX12_006338 [Muraenolepis orangiensis]
MVSWLKNGTEVEPDNQFVVTLDQGRFASLTINGVSMENSGIYSMIVQNKYGGESVDIVPRPSQSSRRARDEKSHPHQEKTWVSVSCSQRGFNRGIQHGRGV